MEEDEEEYDLNNFFSKNTGSVAGDGANPSLFGEWVCKDDEEKEDDDDDEEEDEKEKEDDEDEE